MAAHTLVGAALMGLLVLAVGIALARWIDWRSNEIFAPKIGGESILLRLARHPVVWAVSFVALALGLTLITLVAVGGFGISSGAATLVGVAAFALLLFGYLVGGTYGAIRDRDVSPAMATLIVTSLLGGLLLVAISGKLLMGP